MSEALRFGIHVLQEHTSVQRFAATFTMAEDLGYEWASVYDRFVAGLGSDQPLLEGFTLLSAMAMRTTRIRLGVLVAGATYRHPVVLAKLAATVDHLSSGRLELGVGSGGFEDEHARLGIPFPPAGDRLDAFDETLQILRLLWTELRTDFTGEHFTLRDAPAEPKPMQAHLPLWIGGGGEQRTLRSVARFADGWNYVLLPPDEYRHKLSVLAQHCADVGRDPSSIRKQVLIDVLLGETDEEITARLGPERASSKPGLSRRSRLIGTGGQAAEVLVPYVDIGVRDFVLIVQPEPDLRSIELFARDVAPILRARAGG